MLPPVLLVAELVQPVQHGVVAGTAVDYVRRDILVLLLAQQVKMQHVVHAPLDIIAMEHIQLEIISKPAQPAPTRLVDLLPLH